MCVGGGLNVSAAGAFPVTWTNSLIYEDGMVFHADKPWIDAVMFMERGWIGCLRSNAAIFLTREHNSLVWLGTLI